MDVSSDPYEQKLYQMFTSHDVGGRGSLDKDALSKLCKTLELKDRESVLVACLMNGNANHRVTFKGFKEGLLKLLGTDTDEANEHYLHNNTDDDDNDQANDEEEQTVKVTSPTREVSPKFVVAGKKYGRRSRPPSDAFDSSDTDPECTNSDMAVVPTAVNPQQQHHHHHNSVKITSTTSKTTQKVQRSSSHSDIHGGDGGGAGNGGSGAAARKRRPASGTKLKRCASLPAQKKKEDKVSTLGTQHHDSSVESLGNLDFENLSHSLHEVWTDFGQGADSYLYRADLVKVCERVGLSVKIAAKVADEVFEKLDRDPHAHRISFGEFIGLIQSDTTDTIGMSSSAAAAGIYNLADRCASASDEGGADDSLSCISSSTTTLTGRTEPSITCTKETSLHASPHSAEWPVESSAVAIEVIVDMWDSAGIPNSRGLLDSLGFRSKEIRISQLSLAIDDNLQGTNGQEDTMLRASLALHKAEVNALQHAFRQLATQNKKLHANNRDINRRAALLAQEVDERHSHLENTARTEIRQLEMRHTDIVRDLTAQMANDRENWASLTAKLELRIKSLESDDTKLRLECQEAQKENIALESEQILLQKQITELLEENIKLNTDIVEVGERQRTEDSAKDDRDNEELLELMEKISALQLENANLRDKNDELVSEVEEKAVELTKLRGKKQSRLLDVIGDSDGGADSAGGSSATKRRGDSPSKAKISEESPKLGKLRKCCNDMSDAVDSEGSGDWMALNSELNQSSSVAATQSATTTSGFSQEFSSLSDCKDEEIAQLKKRVVDLEAELACTASAADDSGDAEQLRASLEQMRKEFEDLEDYWQGKLLEERQLYEMEQQKSNGKFDELLKKMAEYEEQFLSGMEKDGRLSPIEEKFHLEQQYAELEAETEELKSQAREMLEQKSNEINDLQAKLKRLQHRVLDSAASESQASVRSAADVDSPASSPISYLWHQSTIQEPARDYHNPNYNVRTSVDANLNVTTASMCESAEVTGKVISPIQRPASPLSNGQRTAKDGSDASSVRSFGMHSVASTHSVHKTFPEAICTSPNNLREEIKRLKMMELQLKDSIQELSQHRDSLFLQLQQLQEAKPMLEKAYAQTNHPSLQQRITQLEQRNRNLQHCFKQQQHYAETVVHQSWQQQRSELSELHHRLEGQGIIISEQSQRLANTDILVKELYVENSQLSAAVQRLEQQRSRNSLILQHQGLTGVPGMPSI